MDLVKLAAKHAGKIDPTITKALGKAGVKIPGVSDSKQDGSKPSSDAAAAAPTPVQSTIKTAENATFSNLVPLAPQYAVAEPTELNLKEKTMSLTGDDAKIKDSQGNVLFKVKADLISISGSRTMYDAQGNTIAMLRKKVALIGTTFYLGTAADEKKVCMKRKNKYNPLNANAIIKMGDREIGEIKGDWRAKKFSITIDGKEVATVGRPRTMMSTFMDADSYVINIKPPQGQPVDMAFISLVVIVLDELYHEK